MLYVDLPTGAHHGWGIVGDQLANALGALTQVERIDPQAILDLSLQGPLLQSVNANLRPHHSGLTATRRVGYAVFEHDVLARRIAVRALGSFDAIATACRWGEVALREGGLSSVATIHHGIDRSRFRPDCALRNRLQDRFVIFSGGKFELRKGHDVVARAFQVFAERHADAFLVTAWHNPVPASIATMEASPYSPFTIENGASFDDSVRKWLATTGIDLGRVEVLPFVPNADLASVYGNSDVGLFPNRCEGATNLVLMEYMACGRPVVATDFSGHRDLLTNANSLPLRASKLWIIGGRGSISACWCEPDLEEVLERLEQSYRDRQGLAALGRQAAADLDKWSWERTAERFLELLV